MSYQPGTITQAVVTQLKGESITNIRDVTAASTGAALVANSGDEMRVVTGPTNITITLTAPASGPGLIAVKKLDTGSGMINVVDSTGKLIDGQATQPIPTQYQLYDFLYTGTDGAWDFT